MSKWHLIQNQPLLREIYKEPPLLSYRKGKSLKNDSLELSFEGQSFPILTNRSHVWPVIHFYHHCSICIVNNCVGLQATQIYIFRTGKPSKILRQDLQKMFSIVSFK